MATRYQLHVADWGGCLRCEYSEHRNKVCLMRGGMGGSDAKIVVPADVLFVGQAPGISENATGMPFEGPAGILMDKIIQASLAAVCVCRSGEDCGKTFVNTGRPGETTCCPHCGKQQAPRPLRWALTNLVGCIPPLDEYGKEGEPDLEAIEACRPRLQEMTDIMNPRLVVRVGAFARKWVTPGFKASVRVPEGCKLIDIDHPGGMLPGRATAAQRGLMIQRAEVTLSQSVEDI